MLLAGPGMAEDFGKARIQPKPSPLFKAASPENEGPAANSRRVLPFKYRPIVTQRRHHRDDGAGNWLLALPFIRARYFNRTIHLLRHPHR
jgi:hypothetical protein